MIALNSSMVIRCSRPTWRTRRLEAVIDVGADERPPGFCDGFLDGVQLLRELHAGPSHLDHRDRAAQMALGAPEPLDDLRMGLVQEIFTHAPILS